MSIEEIKKMSPEAQKALATEGMWKHTETLVNKLARNRRISMLSFDISNEAFDERLNEICEKAFKRYEKMSQSGIAFEMMLEQIANGDLTEDDIEVMVEE